MRLPKHQRTKFLPDPFLADTVLGAYRSTTDKINIENSKRGNGVRLRDARIVKNYSLEDLAIATGLTEAEIAAIEDGTSDHAHYVDASSTR